MLYLHLGSFHAIIFISEFLSANRQSNQCRLFAALHEKLSFQSQKNVANTKLTKKAQKALFNFMISYLGLFIFPVGVIIFQITGQ